MSETGIAGENEMRLVEEPLIKRLGLTDAHFQSVYVQAMEKLHAGNIQAAFRDIANLVLLSPTSVQFQLGLAEVALKAEVPELAMQAAAAVIAMAPDRPEGFLLSGQACLAMNEITFAKEDLADAIAKADANPRYAAVGKMARQALILAGRA